MNYKEVKFVECATFIIRIAKYNRPKDILCTTLSYTKTLLYKCPKSKTEIFGTTYDQMFIWRNKLSLFSVGMYCTMNDCLHFQNILHEQDNNILLYCTVIRLQTR